MEGYDHKKSRQIKLEDQKSVTCEYRKLTNKDDSMCDTKCDQEIRKVTRSFSNAKGYSVKRETKKSIRKVVNQSSSEVEITSSRERNNYAQAKFKVFIFKFNFLLI